MHNIGTRVSFLDDGDVRELYYGKIIGYGFAIQDQGSAEEYTSQLYIIVLDNGFYSPDNRTYVSVIVAHHDNVVAL